MVQYPRILHNHVWNPNKECPPPLFGFISSAICCNNLIDSIPLIPLYLSMRNGCGTAILAWVSLLHLCTIEMGSLESQFDAAYIDLLSFHLTIVSSLPLVVLRSILPHFNSSMFLFCYGAIATSIFSHHS